MNENEEYYSNAKWSKIGHSDDRHCNSTSDKNREFAFAICNTLLDRWGQGREPCEIRGTCLETWVTDKDGNKVELNKQADIDDIRRDKSNAVHDAINAMVMLGGRPTFQRRRPPKEPKYPFTEAEIEYLSSLHGKEKRLAVKALKAKYE